MSAISELSHLKVNKAKTPEEKAQRRKEASRDNKAGLPVPDPLVHRAPRDHDRPVVRLACTSRSPDYTLIQPPQWSGLDNYVRMLGDDRLHQSLKVTFIYVVVGVPLQLVLALGIAMLLDKGMRGLPLYRSVFYLPSMLGASVAIALLWRQMFGPDGLVNQFLGCRVQRHDGLDLRPVLRPGHDDPPAHLDVRLADGHLPGRPPPDPGDLLPGRLASTGRGGWTRFTKMTLPLLTPIIFFNLVQTPIPRSSPSPRPS